MEYSIYTVHYIHLYLYLSFSLSLSVFKFDACILHQLNTEVVSLAHRLQKAEMGPEPRVMAGRRLLL